MKVRNGFVSNSSSSSFIICGQNVLESLKSGFNDNELVYTNDEWYKNDSTTFGMVNTEIYDQCKNSNEEAIKSCIDGKLYESIGNFRIKCIYEKGIKDRCYAYDWDDVREDEWYDKYNVGTIFELTDQIKTAIIKIIDDIYNKTHSKQEWDYYIDDCDYPELRKMIDQLIDNIYDNLIKNYREVYVVSFGDNHGVCSGPMGSYVEYTYLGKKQINTHLKTDFKIFHLCEH